MKITDLFRATTRPIVTVLFAFALVWIVLEDVSAPEWFIGLACTTILWWFGDRTVGHIRERW